MKGKFAVYFPLVAEKCRTKRSISEDNSFIFRNKGDFDFNSIRTSQTLSFLNGIDFYKYISKENDTQNMLYDLEISIKTVLDFMKTFNVEMMSYTYSQKEYIDRLKGISNIIKTEKTVSKRECRNHYLKNIAALNYAIEYTEKEVERTQRNIAKAAQFHKILTTIKEAVFVNVQQFFIDVMENSYDTSYLYKLLPYCDKQYFDSTSFVGENSIENDLLNPDTKNGIIVQRMLGKIDIMNSQDFLTIVDAIAEDTYNEKDVFSILLELAWQQKQYPFHSITPDHMPEIFYLTPKIFSPPYLKEPWLSTQFVDLCESNWPFKEISDALISLMLLIDPFDMVDSFWEIIQIAGRVISNVRGGEEREVDFDELFPVLLTCIFATNQRTLMLDFGYAISFRDEMDDSPTRKFAVSHMEGLYVHILGISNNAKDDINKIATRLYMV